MSKVLVVGGAGYIGGIVVDKLQHEVTVFDNLLFEERYLKRVNFVYGDISDTDTIVSLANQFDYVIWMAAHVGDPACEIDPKASEEVNTLAVKRFCERVDPSVKVIFFSTCSVYGASEEDILLNEDSAVAPLSVYGKTKLVAEEYVRNINGVIFRLGTVFGLGDEHSRIRLDLVVNVMTLRAFLDGKLIVNGGDQWRPLISAKDVAGFVVAAVDNFVPGTYNLCFRNITIKALGEEIAQQLNVDIVYNDMPFQDLRNYKVDGSKAINTFNYSPTVSIAQEVSDLYALIKSNRIKDLTSLKYHNGQYLRNEFDKVAAKV